MEETARQKDKRLARTRPKRGSQPELPPKSVLRRSKYATSAESKARDRDDRACYRSVVKSAVQLLKPFDESFHDAPPPEVIPVELQQALAHLADQVVDRDPTESVLARIRALVRGEVPSAYRIFDEVCTSRYQHVELEGPWTVLRRTEWDVDKPLAWRFFA
ncbi:MAG: hypothetical protein LBJ02_00700 [Bifidobacteriaceae bacterium]|jgi:hypothetical protein|nr:hypothetical protein [Bifidobacteriaceae bacterium]